MNLHNLRMPSRRASSIVIDPGYWHTREGRRIRIRDLEDRHIYNILSRFVPMSYLVTPRPLARETMLREVNTEGRRRGLALPWGWRNLR